MEEYLSSAFAHERETRGHDAVEEVCEDSLVNVTHTLREGRQP